MGIILAILSGCLIGSSFVFKKKGLLRSQAAAGEGVGYLKSPLWWLGMTSACLKSSAQVVGAHRSFPYKVMILGELCNFAGTYSLPCPQQPILQRPR